MVFGLVTVWIGIAISYETDWPLGFFVGVMGAAFFLAGQAWSSIRQTRLVSANTRAATAG